MTTENILTIIIISIPILAGIILLIFRIGKTYNTIKYIEKDTKEIKKDVKFNTLSIRGISNFLFSKFGDEPISFFSTMSPVTLTKLGEELFITSGGKIFIENKLNYLISKMEKIKLKSALDIQNYAFDIITDEHDSDDFIPLKNFIYHNPNYKDNEINLFIITRIISIYLRDKYFEKYPELEKNSNSTLIND